MSAISSRFSKLNISKTGGSSREVACLSQLECLPHELLLKIVEYVPEAVLELRLTSRMLKSLVDESSRTKATLPIVEKMRIFVGTKVVKCFAPDIALYVPKCKSKLFKLRIKLSRTKLKKDLEKLLKTNSARHNVYRLRFKILVENEGALNCLRPTLGNRVEKVMLTGCEDSTAVASVSRLLDGIHIEQLSLFVTRLSEDVDIHLLKSDFMNNVQQLTISTENVTVADPVSTLLGLSSCIQSLHIEQNFVKEISEGRNYFFGVFDIDWAQIIIEMFNGKMDKLYIENYFYTGYLSNGSIDLLRERLPSLGKNIWFSASCSDNANQFDYTRKEHSVKDGRDAQGVRRPGTTPRPYSFSVKHQSRMDEPFETFYPYYSAFRAMP
ncbi:hypothetical protein PRIPAC_72726 [Pristionchus pacificus]|uniref:Uncharacterized protein n=1 Tax=Pristionchus pacificus TaxID=54126 RepID=A0A2A6C7R0_PRIPA|nr:hypothetical protein PRIPAC_72726 [Pristionchus pacificus]|eukprot:PDM74245.1 hypothetical protein PRIPAC_41601 [Pristionchus pacificus]